MNELTLMKANTVVDVIN